MEMLIQNAQGATIDVSQIVSNITWTTHLEDDPGRLTFDLVETGLILEEGSVVSFKFEGKDVFLGYIFTRRRTPSKITQITAYDSIRYLKSKDTRVFDASTSPDVFSTLCKHLELNYKIVDNSTFKVAEVVHDNKSYYEMMKYAFDRTLIGTEEMFFVRDNFGILEHCAVSQQLTNLFIGDESLMTNFTFESSINNETYNQIKLIQENQETVRRDVYMVRDGENIRKWGLLQFFESVDENMNEAQIKEKAHQLLSLKNRKTRTLRLTCLGDLRLRAGSGFTLGIRQLDGENIPANQPVFITSCRHTWRGGVHMMDLSVRIL